MIREHGLSDRELRDQRIQGRAMLLKMFAEFFIVGLGGGKTDTGERLEHGDADNVSS